MAIQIIDNFSVNVSIPIDTRIVASGSTARAAIPFKYDGLRVYDIGDRKPYVWNAISGSWIEESQGNVMGNGIVGRIAMWQTTTGLTNSIITQTASVINITGDLTVSGNITGNINANNINSGTLPIIRGGTNITNIGNAGSVAWSNGSAYQFTSVGTSGHILRSNGTSAPSWLDPSGLIVGTATNATTATNANNVFITDNTTDTSINYLSFVNGVGNRAVRVATAKLRYIPSSGQIVINDGQASTPSYSFMGSTNSGMYLSGTNVNFSASGTIALSLNSTTVGTTRNIIVSSTGRIGINVTNPSERLHINGKGLFYNSVGDHIIVEGFSGEAKGGGTVHNPNNILFRQNWDTVIGTSVVDLSRIGFVGNSLNILRIDTLRNDSSISFRTTTAGVLSERVNIKDGFMNLIGGLSLNFGVSSAIPSGRWGIEYWEGGLNFWRPFSSISSTLNYALFIRDSDGNVGIGTGTPLTKLHINGTNNNLRIQGVDHVFMELFRSTVNTRSAWFGYGSSNSTTLTIKNETSGETHVISNTNGVRLVSGGTSWSGISDIRLKNIQGYIETSIDKIKTLDSIYYNYKTEDGDIRRVGLIAQQVKEVLPEAVYEGEDGYLSLSLTEVVPLLVSAIKELSEKIDNLKKD
jgi:hypothetical protein